MTATKFDEIVEARANERVQARIKQLRTDLRKAFATATTGNERMFDGYYNNRTIAPNQQVAGSKLTAGNARDLLQVVYGESTTDNKGEWPAWLWKQERLDVSRELLATLDSMQQALLAASKPADPEDARPA